MSDLERRIIRLEAQRRVASASAEDAAKYARHQRRMTGLAAFIDEAFPDGRDCVAHHVAKILGLPDAPALRAHLKGQSLEEIARARYGTDWWAEMEATGVAAAVHCEAAHGSGWQGKFMVLWQGDG